MSAWTSHSTKEKKNEELTDRFADIIEDNAPSNVTHELSKRVARDILFHEKVLHLQRKSNEYQYVAAVAAWAEETPESSEKYWRKAPVPITEYETSAEVNERAEVVAKERAYADLHKWCRKITPYEVEKKFRENKRLFAPHLTDDELELAVEALHIFLFQTDDKFNPKQWTANAKQIEINSLSDQLKKKEDELDLSYKEIGVTHYDPNVRTDLKSPSIDTEQKAEKIRELIKEIELLKYKIYKLESQNIVNSVMTKIINLIDSSDLDTILSSPMLFLYWAKMKNYSLRNSYEINPDPSTILTENALYEFDKSFDEFTPLKKGETKGETKGEPDYENIVPTLIIELDKEIEVSGGKFSTSIVTQPSKINRFGRNTPEKKLIITFKQTQIEGSADQGITTIVKGSKLVVKYTTDNNGDPKINNDALSIDSVKIIDPPSDNTFGTPVSSARSSVSSTLTQVAPQTPYTKSRIGTPGGLSSINTKYAPSTVSDNNGTEYLVNYYDASDIHFDEKQKPFLEYCEKRRRVNMHKYLRHHYEKKIIAETVKWCNHNLIVANHISPSIVHFSNQIIRDLGPNFKGYTFEDLISSPTHRDLLAECVFLLMRSGHSLNGKRYEKVVDYKRRKRWLSEAKYRWNSIERPTKRRKKLPKKWKNIKF